MQERYFTRFHRKEKHRRVTYGCELGAPGYSIFFLAIRRRRTLKRAPASEVVSQVVWIDAAGGSEHTIAGRSPALLFLRCFALTLPEVPRVENCV